MKPPAFGWFLVVCQLGAVCLAVTGLVLIGLAAKDRERWKQQYVVSVRKLSHRMAEGRCMWVAPPQDTSAVHHW